MTSHRSRIGVAFIPFALLATSGCGEAPKPAASVATSADRSAPTVPVARAPIQFEEVAEEKSVVAVSNSGTTREKHFPTANGTGIALGDFDLDGWLDLYVPQSCRPDGVDEKPPNRYFRNRRFEQFEDCGPATGADVRGYTAGTAVGDIDADGFPDLYLTRLGPNILLRNNGDGTFSDRSKSSGTNGESWGTSAAFLDYDEDGALDLYVDNYAKWDLAWHAAHDTCSNDRRPIPPDRRIKMYCSPNEIEPARHFLYRSRGDGTFEDRLKEAGIERTGSEKNPGGKGGRGQGVVTCDLNNDGRCDIYVANDQNHNFTFINLGGGKFADVTEVCGAADDREGKSQAGMGVDAQDVDGDGLPELFVTNFYWENNTLYRNMTKDPRDVSFYDASNASRAGLHSKPYVKWGTSLEDLDGDGWPDILVVNGHVDDNLHEADQQEPYKQEAALWRNAGEGKFDRVTSGLSPFFETKRSARGAAFGDVDNDGMIDVAISAKDEPVCLLRNTSRQAWEKPYAWIQLALVGTVANRDAIGARVEIHLAGRKLTRHVRGGRSYMSAHDPRLTIGLGDAKAVEKVVVYWPGGKAQTLEKPAINQAHLVRERLP